MADETATEADAPIVAARLRALLDYDPETGAFTWRCGGGRGRPLGKVAGSRHSQGYRSIRVDGRLYLAHRLAWLHATGEWPRDQIDHIDGNRGNNRLANLRECTNAQNCQNVRSHWDSTSNYVGVSLNTRSKRQPWQAQICVAGRQHNLGYFASEHLAAAARATAKRELHTFSGKAQ